jgi:hypothetical protein
VPKGIVVLVVLLNNKSDRILNTSKWTQHNNMEGTVNANKTGSVHITKLSGGAFMQQLLQWKSNKYYIFLVCVCRLKYSACIAHVPFYVVYCVLFSCRLYFHIIS